MQAQRLSNLLAAVNELVKDSNLVCYIIGELSTEFDMLVASLTTRLEPTSLEGLYAHLLTFEQRHERNNSISDLVNSSVHVAQRHKNSHGKPQCQFFVPNGPSNGHGHGRDVAVVPLLHHLALPMDPRVNYVSELVILLPSAITGLTMLDKRRMLHIQAP